MNKNQLKITAVLIIAVITLILADAFLTPVQIWKIEQEPEAQVGIAIRSPPREAVQPQVESEPKENKPETESSTPEASNIQSQDSSETEESIVVSQEQGKIIFVTSQSYSGNLRKIIGADEKCQNLADAAGIGGTFIAWISTREINAIDRFVEKNGPYYDVKGVLIANNFEDLANGIFVNLLKTTENGVSLPSVVLVWTGTKNGGMKKGDTEIGQPYCYFWTVEVSPLVGNYGQTAQSGAKWTDAGTARCSRKLRLYCIED